MSALRICLLAAIAAVCVDLEAAVLKGRAVDPLGNPLVGVQLFLVRDDKVVGREFTDAAGSFQFVELPAGRYVVLSRQLGAQQASEELNLADDDTREEDLVFMPEVLREEVTVTATRASTPSSLLGNSVTVITAAAIAGRHVRSVADLLRTVPGVHVVRAGGSGALTSLFVRGGESDYTKVLLDGVPINQPGGAVDLSNLSTANIERVEIVRGPQSALYGSDAISGVIQIFTAQPDPEAGLAKAEVTLEGGSLASYLGQAAVSGQRGRFSYSAAVQHRETDNEVPNNHFRNRTYSSSLGIRLSERSFLRLLTRGEQGRTGVPGPTLFGRPDLEEYYRKHESLAGLTWDYRVSEFWRQRVTLSQSQVSQLSEDPADSGMFLPSYEGRQAAYPAFDFVYSYLNSTRRRFVNYQSEFFVSTHVLSTGLDFEQERGVVGEVRARRRNLGYYVQDQFMVGERLALTGGLRLEDNGSFGFAVTPRVSSAYLLRAGEPGAFWGMTRSKFNLGFGIKEPNLVESFSSNPYFRGNPDLKPERTSGVEVGVEQRLWDDRVKAEVSFFYDRIHNQIELQTTDFQTYEAAYFNLGESRVWGVEHQVRLLRQGPLELSCSYTYLNSRILKSYAPFNPVLREGRPLLRRPSHSGSISAGWRTKRWNVSSTLDMVGRRGDLEYFGLGLDQVAGYASWEAAGAVVLSPHVELYVLARNLLNRRYSETIGYAALKFNTRTGLRFSF